MPKLNWKKLFSYAVFFYLIRFLANYSSLRLLLAGVAGASGLAVYIFATVLLPATPLVFLLYFTRKSCPKNYQEKLGMSFAVLATLIILDFLLDIPGSGIVGAWNGLTSWSLWFTYAVYFILPLVVPDYQKKDKNKAKNSQK